MQMNILNQTPANGHSALPAARGHQHHHHPQQHQDAYQNLLPVALPLPPSSPLRSSQPPCRSTRTPLRVEEPPNRDGAAQPAAVKSQLSRRQSRTDAAGPVGNVYNLSHLLDGGAGVDGHPKFPAPATPGRRHGAKTEGKCKAAAAGDMLRLLKPCTVTALGFVRSLVEDRKLSLIEGAVGSVGRLFCDPEPAAGVTLAVSVSSAVKLEGRQMDQIAKKMRRLTGFSNVRLENTVDPSLIAGFVISYGVGDEHTIDLSVKGRLAQLEAQLESSDQCSGEGWSFPTAGRW